MKKNWMVNIKRKGKVNPAIYEYNLWCKKTSNVLHTLASINCRHQNEKKLEVAPYFTSWKHKWQFKFLGAAWIMSFANEKKNRPNALALCQNIMWA